MSDLNPKIEDLAELPQEAILKLSKFQKAFGQSIATPFGWIEGEIYCKTNEYSKDLLKSIKGTKQQTPIERLKTYNQQYWYRLLDVMQQEFPLLCAHLGYFDFNRWASQYLELYPSASHSLNNLVQFIPAFLEIDHSLTPIQKEWVLLDFHISQLFTCAEQEIEIINQIKNQSLDDALNVVFDFQPGFYLSMLHTDHFKRRNEFKQGQFREAGSFAIGEFGLAAYRIGGTVDIEELSILEYRLLKKLLKPLSLTEAITELYTEINDKERIVLVENVQEWFQRWTSLNFFVGTQENR